MRAKTLTIVSIMVAAMLFTVSLSWAKGGNADRQKKQIRRISGGVKSGEITRKESKRLGREQRRIGQIKRNARADGRVNARERRRIHNLQDRASRHIYLAKHNGPKRYTWKPPHRHRHFRVKPGYHHYPLHYGHKPAYYGYHFGVGYADPHYSFSWSIGWW